MTSKQEEDDREQDQGWHEGKKRTKWWKQWQREVEVREVGVTSRHTRVTNEVLKEEDEVDRETCWCEVNGSKRRVEVETDERCEPEQNGSEEDEDSTQPEDVVEVSNNVVSVMQQDVNSRVREYNTCDTTKCEESHESNHSEVRRRDRQRWRCQPCKSAEDFDASGKSDDNCSSSEVSTSVNV
jgi:hypothetical protein